MRQLRGAARDTFSRARLARLLGAFEDSMRAHDRDVTAPDDYCSKPAASKGLGHEAPSEPGPGVLPSRTRHESLSGVLDWLGLWNMT